MQRLLAGGFAKQMGVVSAKLAELELQYEPHTFLRPELTTDLTTV